MSGILEELNMVLIGSVPIETGVFSDVAPDEYIVITPLADNFALHANDRPDYETQEARLSLYSKGNYLALKNNTVEVLLDNDFTITARQYIGHEDDTGYHHYAIDVMKVYSTLRKA